MVLDRPLVIVVAEDDEDSRELLVLALQMAGFVVHGAGTIAGAAALIASLRPDVLIADYSLPDGNGSTLTSSPEAARSVRILLTGFDAQAIDSAGADAVLTKPVSPEAIVAMIRKHARA